MTGDHCLVTLQPTIFQNIGIMLTELDDADNISAARCDSQQGECNLLSSRRPVMSKFNKGKSQSKPQILRPNYRPRNTQKKTFCRICYHAGAASNVYLSHPISACTFLTKADRADLRGIKVDTDEDDTPGDSRWQSYRVPGWDLETDSDNETESSSEINCESYLLSGLFPVVRGELEDPGRAQLNHILPIPSQILETNTDNGILPITLDSGATLSFIREDLVSLLRIPVLPNSQLATLADKKTFIMAVGEINTTVMFQGIPLKLRALVVRTLQAPCFGGTTFHVDNEIQTDIAHHTIVIGRRTFNQSNKPPSCKPTSEEIKFQVGANNINSKRSVQVKEPQAILPNSPVEIPVTSNSHQCVAITPSFQGMDPNKWPAQICPVVNGCAMYVNQTSEIISCPKYSHFTLNTVSEVPSYQSTNSLKPCQRVSPPVSIDLFLKQIQINTALLDSNQLDRLDQLHRTFASVFDGDLTEGYNHAMGHYEVSFAFKDTLAPPPLKVWAPQYSRSCQELLQAKCDELELQGVLVDPMEVNTQILHLSPIMIQQKGQAKFKKLQDCSVEDVRFISCQNVLNESIRPIPSTSTSHIKIMKFLGRWKYYIFADLQSSYFQIPIDRKLWGYMAVQTPYRGIKLLTRAGQGLLNSDVHLDQLVCKVLGDELSKGIIEVARDDIQVGGNSIDELIHNWALVLDKLHRSNLKISPNKVRILLNDVEVYGIRLVNGCVMPSPHRISNLGKIKMENIKTVKQLNSWRGLYKTLIGHLPHLSYYMEPFDKFSGSRKPSDKLEWTPELTLAFKNAITHLEQANKTFLPHPSDHLILKPDTAKTKTCTGWVLYALRRADDKERLLPVMYCSARLPEYMSKWYPCELEAVGSVLAIDQVAHWINESIHPTVVMPDSMPVVKAANLMKQGRHSKNPRLQSLLACVNRRNVVFVHNSAKKGAHIVPDTLSRLDGSCSCQDCSVTKFLDEVPKNAELMSIAAINNSIASVTNIIWNSTNPAIISAVGNTVLSTLNADVGGIPFGNKKIWKSLQQNDLDCKSTIDLLISGNLPTKKTKNKINSRLLRDCCVNKQGLLVMRQFDPKILREMEKIVVPQPYLSSILTLLHNKMMHPTNHQMMAVFNKYFFAPNLNKSIEMIKESCDTCISVAKLPKEFYTMQPNKMPSQPGSHINADIIRRSKQKILICTDMFSAFSTASFLESETREALVQALIRNITPIRNSPTVIIRSDRAPAFSSLVKKPSSDLQENGIIIELGQEGNKNSNAIVDKVIQELESEIKKIASEEEQLSEARLGYVITILNSRVRSEGLSSSEIHFSRDPVRNINLHLDDSQLATNKLKSRLQTNSSAIKNQKTPPHKKVEIGDTVVVTHEGSKHCARAPHVVTDIHEDDITLSKVLHSSSFHPSPPKWSPVTRKIKQHLLTVRKKSCLPSHTTDDSSLTSTTYTTKPWYPTRHSSDSESDEFTDDEDITSPMFSILPEPVNILCPTLRQYEPPNSRTSNAETDLFPADIDNLNQPRQLKKKDRVTFYNELTNRWTIATITSGPNKYYTKHGQYHNFRTDNNEQGGHYFNPRGLWSLLSEHDNQATIPDNTQTLPVEHLMTDFEETSFYIDEEYDDQLDISHEDTRSQLSPLARNEMYYYPSAASFPDHNLTISHPLRHRVRFMSTSEPDLPTQGCHEAIQLRLRRWGSALRNAWSSSDLIDEDLSDRDHEGGEERKGEAPPHY